MKEIVFGPLQHRAMECIGIYFEISSEIQRVIEKTGVVTFSHTECCWYTRLCRENDQKLCFVLKRTAVIEQSALYRYMADKRRKTDSLQIPAAIQPVKFPVHHPVANELRQAVRISQSERWKGSIFQAELLQKIHQASVPGFEYIEYQHSSKP
jgi:hypothetical protein